MITQFGICFECPTEWELRAWIQFQAGEWVGSDPVIIREHLVTGADDVAVTEKDVATGFSAPLKRRE